MPLDHDEISFVFDKAKISFETYVVFQGPEYPDPNPPPVDEKAKKATGKKGGKGEIEEVEIPMLKPDPIRIIGESGRTIKLELIKVNEPDFEKKKGQEEVTQEETEIIVMRLDYRDDLEDARRNIEIKKKIDELPPGTNMEGIQASMQKTDRKLRQNTIQSKKAKTKTMEQQSSFSQKALNTLNTSNQEYKDSPKSHQLMAKRTANIYVAQGPQTTALYEETLEEDFDHLMVFTGDGGIVTVEDLEFPDNHPEGKFFIRLTDATENLEEDYMLPEFRIPISIGQAIDEKAKKAKGKK